MEPRKRPYRKSGTLLKVLWGRKIHFPKKNFKCYIGSWYPVSSSSYSRPEPPFLCLFGAAGKYTFSSKGSKNVPIKGLDDKRQITATFLVGATGSFLRIQLIYQGKSERCLPKFTFPSNFHVAFTPIHCEKLFKEFYLSIFVCQKEGAWLPRRPALPDYHGYFQRSRQRRNERIICKEWLWVCYRSTQSHEQVLAFWYYHQSISKEIYLKQVQGMVCW